MIVGGLRHSLEGAGQRSAQSPAANAMGRWQAEPVVPAPALQSLFARDHSAPRLRDGGQVWRGYEEAILTPSARAEAAQELPQDALSFPLGVARGQVAGTYIIAEAEDGLVIVDQHAAHERLVLERLRAAGAGDKAAAAQALLLPEVVELDEPACDRLEDRAGQLADFGLALERFGPSAMLVRSVPAALAGGDVQALVRDVADDLAVNDDALLLGERLDHVLATMACHGSVRTATRDGAHAAVRPVQPWPANLGQAGTGRRGKAVRAKVSLLSAPG
jgi:DNA mismatch repair protein MutL